jgi:hypothetical protein
MVAERVQRQKRNAFDEKKLINLLKKNQIEKKQQIDVRNIDTSHLKMSFRDTLYPEQWYLVSYFFNIFGRNKERTLICSGKRRSIRYSARTGY